MVETCACVNVSSSVSVAVSSGSQCVSRQRGPSGMQASLATGIVPVLLPLECEEVEYSPLLHCTGLRLSVSLLEPTLSPSV